MTYYEAIRGSDHNQFVAWLLGLFMMGFERGKEGALSRDEIKEIALDGIIEFLETEIPEELLPRVLSLFEGGAE